MGTVQQGGVSRCMLTSTLLCPDETQSKHPARGSISPRPTKAHEREPGFVEVSVQPQ